MKDFFKKWKELIILIIVIIVIIVLVTNQNEKSFNKVNIKTSNHITNITSKKYLDTILIVGLKELKIQNSFVLIKPLINTEKEFVNITYDIKAHVINSGNNYIIYIIETNKDNSIDILSHELIHLKQYNDKKLIIRGSNVIWNDSVYDGVNLKYEDRPWEIDATNKKENLKIKIEKILFSKN